MFLDSNRVKVQSFMVEYECQKCDVEHPTLIEATDAGVDGQLPERTCPSCAQPISPCDYVPRQIAFLRQGEG